MVGETNPVFVVVDGHPVHKSALVRQYIESQGGKLQLFFLPPYSPQLNPDEQVWAHVKQRVSSQFVESKDEMKRLTLGALRRIQKFPNLVRSFFGITSACTLGCDNSFRNLSKSTKFTALFRGISA